MSDRQIFPSMIALALSSVSVVTAALEEVEVIASTPVSSIPSDMMRLPYAIQRADAVKLTRDGHLDLTDYALNRMGSVSINSAQNNPLQPDVSFRGFTVSPLLGLPQGLSVYQNGARLNEPLGDSVNWDLMALSAVNEMTLHSGSNPLYGLNSLGGAMSMTLKNGFTFEGHQLSASAGSWNRQRWVLESGGNNGVWGYYVNLDGLDEDGWRDLSESEALRGTASISWRNDDVSGMNLAYQYGDSDLIGNGASPVGLLAEERDAVFTAPDITANKMHMVTLDGFHQLNDRARLTTSLYYRDVDTDSFNGDASELMMCEYAGGGRGLLEEGEELEEHLEDVLDIDLDDICEGEVASIRSTDDLEEYLEMAADSLGLDEEFDVDDIADELGADAILTDEAINNISNRQQQSWGVDTQVTFTGTPWGDNHNLIVGLSYHEGDADFRSRTELAGLNPETRSTEGLGTGTFLEDEAVDVNAEVTNASVYFSNTWEASDQLAVFVSGRFNRTEVTLRDQSGERPELNGDHRFSRFNASLGANYRLSDDSVVYASLSESSRAPTPIELACNEGVFEVARRFAEARGDDPDDIDFECRLPNAFLADPPLKQVVSRHFETGLRSQSENLDYALGVFASRNRDDILFQSTGRSTGLFANVDATERVGIEASGRYRIGAVQLSANYTWLQATFADDMKVLSPNHSQADEEGEISVRDGDSIPGIPEHQFKFAADWQATESVSLGLEWLMFGDQYLRGDESNQMSTVDGYQLLNLSASVAMGQRLQLFARVDNVLDTEYENFGLLGEEPDEVIDGLADERPIFLGAGAPRAAWVGFRYRL